VQLGNHVQREMTILFSDIRDFTSLSEKMPPDENFNFINSYLGKMEPVISQNHGFIDKYIGDGIMALFPNADDAVRGAIVMLKTLSEYNKKRQEAGYKPIKIGIGLNT
jgi:class 3 adenylate cyclase